jgi:hypothetical protein
MDLELNYAVLQEEAADEKSESPFTVTGPKLTGRSIVRYQELPSSLPEF